MVKKSDVDRHVKNVAVPDAARALYYATPMSSTAASASPNCIIVRAGGVKRFEDHAAQVSKMEHAGHGHLIRGISGAVRAKTYHLLIALINNGLAYRNFGTSCVAGLVVWHVFERLESSQSAMLSLCSDRPWDGHSVSMTPLSVGDGTNGQASSVSGLEV
jgi:hypothetical protein